VVARESGEKGQERSVIDPEWTPQAGYSHADALLAIIKRQEREADDNDGDDNPEAHSR
jgi:hypothetical protein